MSEGVKLRLKLLHLFLSAVVLFSFLVCRNSTNKCTSASEIIPSLHSMELPSNLMLAKNTASEQLIHLYYRNLNDHNYEKIYSLEDPTRGLDYRFRLAGYKKYQSVKIVLLKDITSKPDVLPWDLSRYYAVKVYYGILDVKSSDSKFQAALDKFNHRRFVVVKLTKEDPWRLFVAQGYPTEEAEMLWGK